MSLQTLLGARKVAAFFSLHLLSSLVNAAIYMLTLLLFSILLRKEKLAIALFWLVIVGFQGLASDNLTTGLIAAAFNSAIFLFTPGTIRTARNYFRAILPFAGPLVSTNLRLLGLVLRRHSFRAGNRANGRRLRFFYFTSRATSLPGKSAARLSRDHCRRALRVEPFD